MHVRRQLWRPAGFRRATSDCSEEHRCPLGNWEGVPEAYNHPVYSALCKEPLCPCPPSLSLHPGFAASWLLCFRTNPPSLQVVLELWPLTHDSSDTWEHRPPPTPMQTSSFTGAVSSVWEEGPECCRSHSLVSHMCCLTPLPLSLGPTP